MSYEICPRQTRVGDFLIRLFGPWCLKGKPQLIAHYASSIGWLEKALGRPPVLVDLDRDNLIKTLARAAAAGIGSDRLKTIRQHLRKLHAYALELEILTTEWETVPLPPARESDAPHDQPLGPLVKHYRAKIRPGLVDRLGARQVRAHDRAAVDFERFIAEHWEGPIGEAAVDAFAEQLAAAGLAPGTVRLQTDCLKRILRVFAPEIAPAKTNPNRNAEFRRKLFGRPQQLPPPGAGTLRAMFEDEYFPERLADADPGTVQHYRRVLECLRVHAGRDVLITELTDALIVGYLQVLREAGMSPRRVNHERSQLLALWRHAYQTRRLDTLPRVRKLKEFTESPTAWTESQLRQLLAACGAVDYAGDIDGLPFADFWTAAILVAYYTAIRRRALFSIRRDDVDLARGIVRVRGRGMKNRRGQAFQVGADCVAALERIWQPPRELLLPWPFSKGTIDKHFRRIKAAAGLETEAGLPLQSFHRIRRSTATLICDRAGLPASSQHLGHSSTALTSARYVDAGLLQSSAANHLRPLVDPPADADAKGGAQ